MRREFGRAAVAVSLVEQPRRVRRHYVSVTDRVRRLGWWVLWLLAERSLHLWLAESERSRRSPRGHSSSLAVKAVSLGGRQ